MQQRGGERCGVDAAQVHQEKRGKRLGRTGVAGPPVAGSLAQGP